MKNSEIINEYIFNLKDDQLYTFLTKVLFKSEIPKQFQVYVEKDSTINYEILDVISNKLHPQILRKVEFTLRKIIQNCTINNSHKRLPISFYYFKINKGVLSKVFFQNLLNVPSLNSETLITLLQFVYLSNTSLKSNDFFLSNHSREYLKIIDATKFVDQFNIENFFEILNNLNSNKELKLSEIFQYYLKNILKKINFNNLKSDMTTLQRYILNNRLSSWNKIINELIVENKLNNILKFQESNFNLALGTNSIDADDSLLAYFIYNYIKTFRKIKISDIKILDQSKVKAILSFFIEDIYLLKSNIVYDQFEECFSTFFKRSDAYDLQLFILNKFGLEYDLHSKCFINAENEKIVIRVGFIEGQKFISTIKDSYETKKSLKEYADAY